MSGAQKTQAPNREIFRKAIEKYLEVIIEIKGHAWCMDIRDERQKMARLVSDVLTDAVLLESEVRPIGSDEILVRCTCGRDVILMPAGKDYLGSYVGRCYCQKGWALSDWPAELPF